MKKNHPDHVGHHCTGCTCITNQRTDNLRTISKGVLESVKIAGCRRINLDALKVVASVGAVERTGKVGRPRHKATTPAQRRESRSD